MTVQPLERSLAVIFLFVVALASLGLLIYDILTNTAVQFYILTILYASITSCSTIAGIQVSSGATIKASNAAAGIAADAMSKGIDVGTKLAGGNGSK